MARTRTPSTGSPLVTLVSIVVAIAALHLAKEILLPLALAIFLSFLLTPLANRLEGWGFGRIPSVISVVGVTFVVLGVLGWIVANQLINLSVQLPHWKGEIIRKIEDIRPNSPTLANVTKTIEEVTESIRNERPTTESTEGSEVGDESAAPSTGENQAENPQPEQTGFWGFLKREMEASEQEKTPMEVRVVGMPPSPLGQIREWLGPMVAPLTTAGIAVVLVIFILLKREDQRNRLLLLFGSTNLHASTEALTDVTERVSKYLRMQFLINAGYGIAVGLGLAAIGVPNAIMWGVLSFSLRFLPYIGPWMSAIMPLAVSIADSEGWSQPFMVLGLFIVLELIVNNVAEPLLYGRSTGVSGVGVIVAAIFWTWIWGPIGLVLAMPLTVCVVVMSRYIPAIKFLAVLLGDQQTMPAPERIYQRLLAGDVEEATEYAREVVASSSLVEAYDQAIIPALILSESDRHSGRLHEEQVVQVHETARDLIEELSHTMPVQSEEDALPASELAAPRPPFRVLCIPLRDQADDISADMLEQLLVREAIDVEMAGVTALTGELVDAVQAMDVDMVILSIVPPLPPRSSRLLCRRLRDRCPNLPVLIGYWGGERVDDIRRRLADDQSEIVTTLAGAVERVQAIAARPRTAENAG